ncbi:MAG: hypothetical protein RIA69_02640 [Cyclobacteriaceae bacterium]
MKASIMLPKYKSITAGLIAFFIEIAHLKKFIQSCNEMDIEVICYLAPYHPLYKHKMQNLDEIIQMISSQIQHPIIDLSNEFSEDEYFADRVHTNVKGAKALSNALLKVSLRGR